MNKIGKISTVRFRSSGKGHSIRESLTSNNLQRTPGSLVPISPWKETDGSYRTGLDENAAYIKRITNKELRDIEIATVKSLREEAELMFYNVDLTPKADFYTKMFIHGMDKEGYCKAYCMKDGDNTFNLNDPMQLITYAFLRVHPLVAPSAHAQMSGNYSRCNYYVNDSDIELEQTYRIKSEMAKAFAKIEALNPTKLRQVARQCGFAVSDTDKDESVKVKLYGYVEDAEKPNKSHNLVVFNNFHELGAEDLMKRDTIKQAFTYGVLTNRKNAIYRGDNRIAANEDELVNILFDVKNQDDYLAIEQELKIKKSQIHA